MDAVGMDGLFHPPTPALQVAFLGWKRGFKADQFHGVRIKQTVLTVEYLNNGLFKNDSFKIRFFRARFH